MADSQGQIRVVIVDDEPGARRSVRQLLERDPAIEVVGETAGPESPDVLRELQPDLVMMDIHMPGMSGFEVLHELLPEELPLVVFVTAYDEHAVQAFELRALDYVVKPFSDRRLLEALALAKERIRSRETERAQHRLLQLLRSRLALSESGSARTALSQAPESVPGDGGAGAGAHVAVRDGGRILMLRAAEIVWVEAAGSYSRIHFERGSELVRATLGALEDRLEDHRFFRIHRSAIVALDHVQEVRHESHGDYLVELRDGTELRLARSRKAEFELRVGLT